MLKTIIIFLLFCSIECVKIHSKNLEYLTNLFELFQNEYRKEYRNSNEKNLRFSIFKNNSKSVTAHNMAYLKGETKYYQKLNQFADMTHEEYKQWVKRSGHKMSHTNREANKLGYEKQLSDNLQKIVDLRQELPSIKFQENCGSCWAFGAVAAIEHAYYLKYAQVISLSEQQLVDCVYNETHNSCTSGGDVHDGKSLIL